MAELGLDLLVVIPVAGGAGGDVKINGVDVLEELAVDGPDLGLDDGAGLEVLGLVLGAAGLPAVGTEDELGVGVDVEGGDDVGVGEEELDDGLDLGLGGDGGTHVGVAGRVGAGTTLTPVGVPVPVGVNTEGGTVAAPVLPPEPVGGPGVFVAVGVDDGDDDELVVGEEGPVLGQEVPGEVVDRGPANPLAGVLETLEVDSGLASGTKDNGEEVAALVALADGGDEGGTVGGGVLLVPGLELGVGVVLGEPGGVEGGEVHLGPVNPVGRGPVGIEQRLDVVVEDLDVEAEVPEEIELGGVNAELKVIVVGLEDVKGVKEPLVQDLVGGIHANVAVVLVAHHGEAGGEEGEPEEGDKEGEGASHLRNGSR